MNMDRGMVVADYCDVQYTFHYHFLFSVVFIYSSKVFSRVANSDPSNKEDRYSLILDFVGTSRVLEILPSKST